MHPTVERCTGYPVVHRDYECRSKVDLKKVGHHVYAADPSTEILVAVWIIEYERGKLSEPIIWHAGDLFPAKVRELIEAGDTVTGHNAAFEAAIDAYLAGPRLGWPVPKLTQLDCTLARAAAQALPLDLNRLGQALWLKVQKDKEGHRLMLQMCKPRVPRSGEDPNGIYWHFDADKLARLTEYCITDVRAEIEADHALRPLQDQEREVWLLDQVMNNRGVQIDTTFVRTSRALIERATARADSRMMQVTDGYVNKITQIGRIKDWAKSRSVELPIMTKTRRNGEEYETEAADREALQDLLAVDLPDDVREAFELRLDAAKSSLSKLDAFISQAPRGRARGALQYHAAGPGRWGGRGIQLQNLPRAGITEQGGWDQAYRDMQELNDDTFELVWGSPFDVVSRMMRGAIIAAPGHKLYFGDYASVEARGCVWAAGQQNIVDLFTRGGKIYEETAAKIFGVAVEDVTKEQRFLGKGAVLGCGYGMGAPKFQKTCKKQGRVIPLELAEKAVHGWREINWRVVELWRELEDAACDAVEDPGTIYKAGPFSYRVKGKWLQCCLPSGRLLWYCRPAMRWAQGANGIGSVKLHYLGVNGVTKQWEEERTWGGKLLENVIQGLCRDFLAGALLRLERADYTPVLSIHDEVIAETPEDFGSVEEFLRLMTELPTWAGGFPLKAEGGSGLRYAKGG
jgi:DNA polymerase